MHSGRSKKLWSSSDDGLPTLPTSGKAAFTIRKGRLSRYRLPLLLLVIVGLAVWLLFDSSGQGQCSATSRSCSFGPRKGPMRMTPNERADWGQTRQSPIYKVSNPHKPVAVSADSVSLIDLNPLESTPRALQNREKVLIVTPLKDAAPYLPHYFDLLLKLTYPHDLIDLAFLVSDSTDNTLGVLTAEVNRIQNMGGTGDTKGSNEEQVKRGKNTAKGQGETGRPFRSVSVIQKDFGTRISQEVRSRHDFEVQAPRRIAMAKARNYLLTSALKADHSWVYWRDVDIEESPDTIIEDLVEVDKDVVVPNVWFHRYEDVDGKLQDIEGRFDYNSWQETDEGREFRKTLSPDVILAEGYKQFATKRKHMALLGTSSPSSPAERKALMELDGVGGVSIMVKADVHRSGINFPTFAFENQVETEGFAQMAKKAGFGVFGLPNYVVWHVDTEEKGGNV